MFIIGLFLFLLGVLCDEGTTILWMLKGYSSFETNPIFVHVGLWYFVICVLLYVFIVIGWFYVVKTGSYVVANKKKCRKYYDVIVFLWCFMIIFMAGTKIEAGYESVGVLVDSFKSDDHYDKGVLEDARVVLDRVRVEQPEVYKGFMVDTYNREVLSLNYLQVIFYVLCSFLLFKVGYKVVPWDLA